MVRTLDFEAKQLTVNTFSWTTFYPAVLHNENKAHSTHDFLFFLFCFFFCYLTPRSPATKQRQTMLAYACVIHTFVC